jgi:hypothetical protein
MIKVNSNILILLCILIIIACEEPAPIEIINEEEVVEISVVNPDPNSYVITGYDSTGISQDDLAQVSIVSLSGIKNTIENITFYKAYGEAVFFDTTKPVVSLTDRLIGFRTLNVGTVKFDNRIANVVPFILRYKENLTTKNIVLGEKHIVEYQRTITPEQLNFRYDRNIDFEIISNSGESSRLNMRIPEEIVGKVEITGSRMRRDLKIRLLWNKSLINHETFPGKISQEIIVGGVPNSRDELIPLFKLEKLKSDSFDIPNSFITDILLSNRFEYIVFSFLRKIRKSNSTDNLGEIYFASQSIHNIWVKI